MGVVAVLATFIAMAWYEGVPLVRRRQVREAIIFAVVWLTAFAYALCVALGVSMPNPLDWIDALFRPITPVK